MVGVGSSSLPRPTKFNKKAKLHAWLFCIKIQRITSFDSPPLISSAALKWQEICVNDTALCLDTRFVIKWLRQISLNIYLNLEV